uniref:Osteopontin n=1 Tax=Apteryx owenii TaxID=8824 RepID=A0A8B9QQG8_APTOW
MKVAVLCLCLISITVAWPVSKSKRHAISASSEEKYDSRGHRSHRQHHHHVNSQSHESLLHPRDDLASPQQVPRFPGLLSKSREDPDDDVDDDDSNDTDESDEVVTDFPTDAPVTAPFPPYPFTRGDNSGRGDSVAYRIKAKATVVKSSKLHKAARKEDESALVTDSHQAGLFGEWGHKSRGRDSNEVVRKLPDWSVENDSRQKFDSPEVERDSSERGARGGIPLSRESRESPAHVLTQVIVVDDNSNQTFESAEDVQDLRSIKNNEVTL